jgi:DNA (cytosine-5)-methyltransferase 1
MNYLSVCSGIEAATVAWHPLGWNPVAFSEIESFPSQVLKHHYPTVPNLGDMTKFKEWEIESNIDVFVGGTPCQSFSVAGLRKGLDDPRGNLMLTYLAIADKFRPKWLVWENVPGVLSSNGGKDFGTFLGGLGELGYGFAYRILDAQYFGVAQRRRRVFVVGYLGDWRCAAAVLFERHSLQGNPAPSRNSWEKIAGTVTARFGNSRNNQEELAPLQYFGNAECKNTDRMAARMVSFGEYSVDGTASSMKARDYKDATDLVAQPIVIDRAAFNQGENAKYKFRAEHGETMDTLVAKGPHAVAYNIAPGKGELKDDIHVTDAYITKTIDASGSNPAMHQGGADIVQPIAFTTEQTPKFNLDQALTLTKSESKHNQCVAQPIVFHPTQDPITSTDGTTHGLGCGSSNGQASIAVAQSMAVRRLTPTECERLQGFPDGYTNIPWRKSAESPDGIRYKALGNSMAVPVMAWIGQRIQKVEDIIK